MRKRSSKMLSGSPKLGRQSARSFAYDRPRCIFPHERKCWADKGKTKRRCGLTLRLFLVPHSSKRKRYSVLHGSDGVRGGSTEMARSVTDEA